jgi:uncharacterized protein (TIGR02391 family)
VKGPAAVMLSGFFRHGPMNRPKIGRAPAMRGRFFCDADAAIIAQPREGGMVDDGRLLRTAHARAVAMRKRLGNSVGYISANMGADLNSIVSSVGLIIGGAAIDFMLPPARDPTSSTAYDARDAASKLDQFITYLEQIHFVSNEIDALFNSIKDPELKRRCLDLLSSSGSFDRVINQATLVLEDRIRTKSGNTDQLTGVQLVNTVLKPDISKTVLKISDDAGEHEGVGHICRGIMLTFRNPTHHHVTDTYSREDALKVCAFIDNLLKLIDNATKA